MTGEVVTELDQESRSRVYHTRNWDPVRIFSVAELDADDQDCRFYRNEVNSAYWSRLQSDTIDGHYYTYKALIADYDSRLIVVC